MKFHVPDMSCAHCTAAIDKALKAADPVAGIATDLDAKTVSLTTSLDAATVQAALQRAGFTATPV